MRDIQPGQTRPTEALWEPYCSQQLLSWPTLDLLLLLLLLLQLGLLAAGLHLLHHTCQVHAQQLHQLRLDQQARKRRGQDPAGSTPQSSGAALICSECAASRKQWYLAEGALLRPLLDQAICIGQGGRQVHVS
jgi:hypothetical protein